MDVEGEEAGVLEVEVAADGDGERDGEVEAEGEVAVERVLEADSLGVGGRGAVGVEGEEAVEGWGLRGHCYCAYVGRGWEVERVGLGCRAVGRSSYVAWESNYWIFC